MAQPVSKGRQLAVKRETDEPPAEPQRREATLKHNGQTSFGPAAFQRARSTPSSSFPLSSPAPTMMDDTELRWVESWKSETRGDRFGRVRCIGFWMFCFVLLLFFSFQRSGFFCGGERRLWFFGCSCSLCVVRLLFFVRIYFINFFILF